MIIERRNINGSIDYIFSVNKPILYNNKIVRLTEYIIPIKEIEIFELPEEKDYYAVINSYYSVEDNKFIFDIVKKSLFFIESYDSKALTNYLPVGQFIVQQSLNSFEVKKINQCSEISTFAITDVFIEGDRGQQGAVGYTGIQGETGLQGETGEIGIQGCTGIQGETAVGPIGCTGLQGETGIYPDLNLLLHLKFKNVDDSLLDYSPYERDLDWIIEPLIYTGIEYYENGSTGVFNVPVENSNYLVVEGIKDNAHKITYKGGQSSYINYKYIGFSGVIQAWINLSQLPIPDFIFEYKSYSGMIGYPVKFIDTSLFASEIEWNINGVVYKNGAIEHTFGLTGIYKVTITAINRNGKTSKTIYVTV